MLQITAWRRQHGGESLEPRSESADRTNPGPHFSAGDKGHRRHRPPALRHRALLHETSRPSYDERVERTFLFVGALAGAVGVGLGAFGAHGLRGRLAPDMLAVFETGVRYHLYHALAILLVAALAGRVDSRWIQIAGWCFTAGIVIFSGSLYVLAVTGVTMLGAITPIGGVAFLAGWACLLVASM